MADRKIYKNLILLALIILSYISLLFFISNEGFKGTSELSRHKAIEDEMRKQSVPLQEANFDEIKINKNLLDVE